MATLALTVGTVRHTLPARYLQLGFDRYAAQESSSGYVALTQGIAASAEIVRFNAFDQIARPPSTGNPDTTLENMVAWYTTYFAPLNIPVIPGQVAGPATPWPSTTVPTSLANIGSAGSGAGTADAVEWVNYIIGQAGSASLIYAIEAVNEPDNNRTGGKNWYVDASAPSGDSARDAADWWTNHVQLYYNAYKAAFPSIPQMNWSIAELKYSNEMTRFLDGYTGWKDGAAYTPGSGANLAYTDILSYHAYHDASDDQSNLNGIFWDGTYADGQVAKYGKAGVNKLRSLVDARGYSSMKLAQTEVGNFHTDYRGGLYDVGIAILYCDMQATWRMDHFGLHSLNRSDSTSFDSIICTPDSGSTWFGSSRYYCIRDIIAPFVQTHKRVVAQTWTVSPANSPAGGNNNAVPRLQAVAALNNAGTELAVMVVNVDLANAETFTCDVGVAPTGNVTGKFMPKAIGQGAQLSTLVPIAPSGTTFSKSIGAGEAYLFLVPVSAGGSDTTPPTLSNGGVPVAYLDQVGLSWSEQLDSGSVPATTDFAVTVNGAPVTVSYVHYDGPALVNLGIPTITAADVVRVSYTPGANPIQDLAGNDAAGFSGLLCDNETPLPSRRVPGSRVSGSRVPGSRSGGARGN